MFRFSVAFSLLTPLLLTSTVSSSEPPAFQKAADALQSCTVTLRIIQYTPDGDSPTASHENLVNRPRVQKRKSSQYVTVCSGISLGEGLIVTHAALQPDARIRITIPGGGQAKAEPSVIDQVSGLILLETKEKQLPRAILADALPQVGQWVLSGAGWGVEKPLISFGILSASNRRIAKANYPPLLQCDLRTAQTSSGSALVNRQGELLGIVVATDAPQQQNQWTFAVPVTYVRDLLNSRKPGKLIVLYRRRPVVGMELATDPKKGQVFVKQLAKDGPAEKAGILVNDKILAADGIKIRSVLQIVLPMMMKQPGDKMKFLVRSENQDDQQDPHEVEITLGSAELSKPAQTSFDTDLFTRQIVMDAVGIMPQVSSKNTSNTFYWSVSEPALPQLGRDSQNQQIEGSIKSYHETILQLEKNLAKLRDQRTKTESKIKDLTTQLDEVKKLLEQSKSEVKD